MCILLEEFVEDLYKNGIPWSGGSQANNLRFPLGNISKLTMSWWNCYDEFLLSFLEGAGKESSSLLEIKTPKRAKANTAEENAKRVRGGKAEQAIRPWFCVISFDKDVLKTHQDMIAKVSCCEQNYPLAVVHSVDVVQP